MLCPGCGSTMDELTLDARLGATTVVNACRRCQAFWFDPFENVQLTEASTLRLFSLIAQRSSPSGPFPAVSYCPHCRAKLLHTHDRQRNTPFEYERCDRGHGRFTRFTEFLKEKDFIRPLSPQQLAELREDVKSVHCSNCGAPIDLMKTSVCEHCGAPVSIVDTARMAELARRATTNAPAASLPQPPKPVFSRPIVLPKIVAPEAPLDLVEHGLRAFAGWLREITGE